MAYWSTMNLDYKEEHTLENETERKIWYTKDEEGG